MEHRGRNRERLGTQVPSKVWWRIEQRSAMPEQRQAANRLVRRHISLCIFVGFPQLTRADRPSAREHDADPCKGHLKWVAFFIL